MTRKDCFFTLGLTEKATLSEVKQAYRRLAFSLHPDLNPHLPDAAQRFQKLNEAYVILSAEKATSRPSGSSSQSETTSKTREEAKKAYEKAQATQKNSSDDKRTADSSPSQEEKRRKEDVLKDILNDSFARRVFEDIYRHIHQEQQAYEKKTAQRTGQTATPHAKRSSPRRRKHQPSHPGLLKKISEWFRKQIDEEQVLHLPGDSLLPGARVRLHIQHGFTAEPQAIELTLPPDFVPGKTIRLAGMGKRIGKWKGDLYVRIEPD